MMCELFHDGKRGDGDKILPGTWEAETLEVSRKFRQAKEYDINPEEIRPHRFRWIKGT